MLRTVLFAPEDLALVKGDPAERRRFLDELLVARAPRFAGVRADYDRVLKQRNALLKPRGRRPGRAGGRRRGSPRRGGRPLRTLDVWDAHLATHGAELLAARLELVDALRPLVAKAYATVAPAVARRLSPTAGLGTAATPARRRRDRSRRAGGAAAGRPAGGCAPPSSNAA